MAANDIWSMTLQGLMQNQVTLTFLTYHQTGSGNDADTVEAIHDFAEEDLLPVIRLAQADQFQWTNIYAQKIWPTQSVAYIRGIDQHGLIEQPPLPLTTTMNVKKLTALAGRKYRGRSYYSGAPTTGIDITTGLWSTAHKILIRDIGIEMQVVIGVDDFSPHLYPCLLHRSDFSDTRIINTAADPVPRVQRRREIGVGI